MPEKIKNIIADFFKGFNPYLSAEELNLIASISTAFLLAPPNLRKLYLPHFVNMVNNIADITKIEAGNKVLN